MGRGRDPHADIASRVEVGLFTFNKQKKIRNQFFFFLVWFSPVNLVLNYKC